MKSLLQYINEDVFDIDDKNRLFNKDKIEGIGEIETSNKKEICFKQQTFHCITNKNLEELITLSRVSRIKRFRLDNGLNINFGDDSKMDFCDISLMTSTNKRITIEASSKNKSCTLSNAFIGQEVYYNPFNYVEVITPGEFVFDHVNISSHYFVVDNRHSQKGLKIPKFINKCKSSCTQYNILISSNLINTILMHPSVYQDIGKVNNLDTIPNKDECMVCIHINKEFDEPNDYILYHKSYDRFNKMQGTILGDWIITRP